MTRKLTADDICAAIGDLEDTTRKALVADILADLLDSAKKGPMDSEADTWESGFRAAMETISSNYSTE
jgi:hypothetical protein